MIDIYVVKMKIIIVIHLDSMFISLSIKIIHTQNPCQVATHFYVYMEPLAETTVIYWKQHTGLTPAHIREPYKVRPRFGNFQTIFGFLTLYGSLSKSKYITDIYLNRKS